MWRGFMITMSVYLTAELPGTNTKANVKYELNMELYTEPSRV